MGATDHMVSLRPGQRRRRTEVPGEFLAGRLIRLRPVTASDLALLLDWDEDPTIVETMGHKFIDRSAGEWLSELRTQRDCLAWMLEDEEGRTIGELELAHLDWRAGSAELRICIGDRERQNRGYGTDAVQTAVRLAFEGLALRRIYLRVYLFNTRAIRVYERAGFRRTGLLRPIARRQDRAPILLMTLTREEWEQTLYRTQPDGDGLGSAALTLTNVH